MNTSQKLAMLTGRGYRFEIVTTKWVLHGEGPAEEIKEVRVSLETPNGFPNHIGTWPTMEAAAHDIGSWGVL